MVGEFEKDLEYLLVPPSSKTQPNPPRPYQFKWSKVLVAAVMLVTVLGFLLYSPEVNASFNLRNMEKTGNNFLMSIGEESILDWEIEPEIEGVKIVLPEGLENLNGDEEYKIGNEGISVRAVKVGKWRLGIETERGVYSPSQEYFVCIGTTKEDVNKYCE